MWVHQAYCHQTSFLRWNLPNTFHTYSILYRCNYLDRQHKPKHIVIIKSLSNYKYIIEYIMAIWQTILGCIEIEIFILSLKTIVGHFYLFVHSLLYFECLSFPGFHVMSTPHFNFWNKQMRKRHVENIEINWFWIVSFFWPNTYFVPFVSKVFKEF